MIIRIYKITNIINGKVYIGQTKQSIDSRFKQHCNKFSYCTKLINAIKKYGKENFIIEEICSCNSRDDADKLEKFWIKEYKSTEDKYGYNILEGGHHPNLRNNKKVICLELNVIFNSAADANSYFNCKGLGDVSRVCRGERPTLKWYHFAFIDESGKPILDKIRFDAPKRHKKTLCVETGEIFKNAISAAQKMGLSKNAVSMCCRGLSKTCGGYHWKFLD